MLMRKEREKRGKGRKYRDQFLTKKKGFWRGSDFNFDKMNVSAYLYIVLPSLWLQYSLITFQMSPNCLVLLYSGGSYQISRTRILFSNIYTVNLRA